MQLARVCGENVAPAPESDPTMGSSYPSGHTAYAWMAALVLAEANPPRAAQILHEADSYGESRVICGVHFPSDVEAGHAIAVAVFERLQDAPEFQADLACARAEIGAGSASVIADCKRHF